MADNLTIASQQPVDMGGGFADPMDPCNQCTQGYQEIQQAMNELQTVCNSCQTKKNITEQVGGSCAQCQSAQQTIAQTQQQINQMGGCSQCGAQPITFTEQTPQMVSPAGQPYTFAGETMSPAGQPYNLAGQTPETATKNILTTEQQQLPATQQGMVLNTLPMAQPMVGGQPFNLYGQNTMANQFPAYLPGGFTFNPSQIPYGSIPAGYRPSIPTQQPAMVAPPPPPPPNVPPFQVALQVPHSPPPTPIPVQQPILMQPPPPQFMPTPAPTPSPQPFQIPPGPQYAPPPQFPNPSIPGPQSPPYQLALSPAQIQAALNIAGSLGNVTAPFGGGRARGQSQFGGEASGTGVGAIGGIGGFGPGAFDIHRRLLPYGIDHLVGNLI